MSQDWKKSTSSELPTTVNMRFNVFLICLGIALIIGGTLALFHITQPQSPVTSGDTSMPQDNNNQTNTYNVTVPASQDVPGIDTGITLQAGQHITITATGSAEYGVDTSYTSSCGDGDTPLTDPDGNRTLDGQSCQPSTGFSQVSALPSAPVGALLGSYGGTGAWFLIGSNYSGDVTTSGEFYLIYNDNPGEFQNNSGSYQVNISVS